MVSSLSLLGHWLRRCMPVCDETVHRWGAAKSILFDPGKESNQYFQSLPHTSLKIDQAISSIADNANRKISRILRTKWMLTVPSVMQLYKPRVLSYIECKTVALYHGAASTLQLIDKLQGRILHSIGITPVIALS